MQLIRKQFNVSARSLVCEVSNGPDAYRIQIPVKTYSVGTATRRAVLEKHQMRVFKMTGDGRPDVFELGDVTKFIEQVLVANRDAISDFCKNIARRGS